MKIPSYTICNTNHPDGKAHGGTAIIIKNEIDHYINTEYCKNYLQATNVTVQDKNRQITFSAIYCPPKFSIHQNTFTEFFDSLGNCFLAGGDYNAKHPWWGSRPTNPNPKGKQLYQALRARNLVPISTGEPTHWPSDTNKLPDLIDFAVVKGLNSSRITAESCLDLSSDHSPIIIKLDSELKIKQKNHSPYNKNTNWNKYKEILDDKITCNIPLKTSEDIENAIEQFNIEIHNAINAATPPIAQKTKISNVSNNIRGKITEKIKLRKIWQKNRTEMNKIKLNKAIKDLKKCIYTEKNEYFQNYLINLSGTENTDYSLWKATKKINQPQQFAPPIKKPDGSWARTDMEKAITFAEHLESVFEPPPRQMPMEEECVLLNDTQINNIETHQINSIKLKEVYKVIKNLKAKKAPGYDNINGKMIKELPPKAFRFITILINSILRLNHFPAQWKVAQIILIPKPGKAKELVTSYRPISLLPILSKVCEKLIIIRLNKILRDKNIIPAHQFGFRNKHSTIEQVNRVTTEIRNTFEKNNYCTTAFLDVAQAFDKVWHEGLLYKLKKILPNNFYNLIKSYLSNRMFQTKINNEVTRLYPIKAGVPQGSVLGPILYLIYTADLPTRKNITLGTYADDTVIIASHSSATIASLTLQNYLLTAQQWFKTWRIIINESKSVQVTFTLRKETCPPVYLNGKPIPQCDKVKYLGMHLDRRLTWKDHIWSKRKQLNLKLTKMYWLIGRKSNLSIENKLLIYKCIIKPVWTYGIQLWGTASKSNIEIIERFQNKTLRNILDAPWFVPNEILLKDSNISSVKEEVKNFKERYKNRLNEHPNSLATNLLHQTFRNSRLKKHNPLF